MEAMMKRKIIWGLVTVFFIFPIGMGIIGVLISDSDSTPQVIPDCSEASSDDLITIESGPSSSTFKISNGKYVLVGSELLNSIQKIAPNASQEKIVAGFINDSKEIGIWTVGLSGGGPINSINTNARKYSVWGSAANPGSRAAQIRDLIDSSPEAKEVSKCVNN
jgi:hypothetical protein